MLSKFVQAEAKVLAQFAEAIDSTYNRNYLQAEYNTATARARTAKQWNDFNVAPIANELYSNLRWLPSRSANPRVAH